MDMREVAAIVVLILGMVPMAGACVAGFIDPEPMGNQAPAIVPGDDESTGGEG